MWQTVQSTRAVCLLRSWLLTWGVAVWHVLAVHLEAGVGWQDFGLPDIVAPPDYTVIFGFVAAQAAQAGSAAGLAGQVEILRRSGGRIQDRV